MDTTDQPDQPDQPEAPTPSQGVPALLLPTTRYRLYLDACALMQGLPTWRPTLGELYQPGEWLEGIILAESSGNPAARRYEPALDARITPAGQPQADDGDFEEACSWGPMQVLGGNIRRLLDLPLGAKINFRAIAANWTIGVQLGLMVLTGELRATGGDVARALARYNGGPTGDRVMPDGSLRRATYVEWVRSRTQKVYLDRGRVGYKTFVGFSR